MFLSRSPLMLFATAALVTACSAADGTDPAEIASAEIISAETPSAELTATSAEALRTDVATARIVRRSATARVLELVDGAGRVVATYYPGFFVATQLVPDIAGRLIVRVADASGGRGPIAYNPDLTPVSCVIVGGEGRRCPLGL